jgi:glutamate/tyrosine decarboxylase-like PLP-dependent enzyme
MTDHSAPLDLNRNERDALGRAALDWCLQYFDAMHALPVYPKISADKLSALLDEALPELPLEPSAVMAQFAAIAEHARHNGHPRMFGYVQSSGAYTGAVADLLASALNLNVTSWRSAPSGTTIERQVVRWIASMVGLPSTTGGLFVSGGSLANLTALATALRACTDVDVAHKGVAALGHEARVYASRMVHMSIPKAVGLLGLGQDSINWIRANASFEMDAAALDQRLAADRAADSLPVCVVATAGDVNTGAIDPLDSIADVCARHGVWFHVDASYGGFAALAPSARGRLNGLARADSIALDPHKWLYAPLDAGCLLVRNPAALRRAFAHGAAYVDVIADEQMSEFAFWDHGPELSRRFRALKIWFALKVHGVKAFADAIESNLRVARYLADVIDNSADFERLAPVPLSIVCFRYVPAPLREPLAAGEGEALQRVNRLNRQLMLELQKQGEAYLSNADLAGAFALRACIVNYRTTSADADLLVGTLRRLGDRLWYAQ